MKPSAEPTSDPAVMTSLVERCKNLCEGAESAIDRLTASDTFLAHNLESALQQLELILRVLGQEGSSTPREEERQGFLRRLFARDDSPTELSTEAILEGVENGDFEPPSFDVSRHGLQGNSWTIPLAELLGFLAFGRKTGVLWVDGIEENFLVGLVDGNLRHATSDCTPEGLRLGEILVGLGFLTRRQLERFLTQQGGDASLISGELLLQSGMISDDELHAALIYQVRQLFYRLVNTPNAVFRFREHMEIMLPFQVNLDINQLLLESAQAQDEIGNAAQRATAVMQDWNAWRAELSSEVGNGPKEVETAETLAAIEKASTASPRKRSTRKTTVTSRGRSKAARRKASKAKDEPAAALPEKAKNDGDDAAASNKDEKADESKESRKKA